MLKAFWDIFSTKSPNFCHFAKRKKLEKRDFSKKKKGVKMKAFLTGKPTFCVFKRYFGEHVSNIKTFNRANFCRTAIKYANFAFKF